MPLRYTSQLDELLKSNKLEDAARFAHEIALQASKRHSANAAQNQLFEPYKDDIQNLRYVHLSDKDIEIEIKRAQELEKVNLEVKNQILSAVIDDVEEEK